ncbi:CPBP family intramembrane glutamic endopeptidase [Halalkalibacillus halophilus]|uniref:CPBP family intramembrane glutamic endopeptidase n=1 Tax=Halalkalibacillus halophilus TaxID=392827 RepID=UPI00041A767C|nr:type II CAAX endopeptidase family protein [Halalkalibacillus halophilus]
MDLFFEENKTRDFLVLIFVSYILIAGFFFILPINNSLSLIFVDVIALSIVPFYYLWRRLRDYEHPLNIWISRPSNPVRKRSVVSSVAFPTLISYGALAFFTAGVIMMLQDDLRLFEQITVQPLPTPAFFMYIFAILIVAPILEEFLFRGYLLGRLTKKYSIGTGIIVSSVIFGLLHGVQFIGATVFGIVMCIWFIYTKSLIVPIIIHFINNAIASVVEIYERYFIQMNEIYIPNPQILGYTGLVAIILGTVWFVYFIRSSWGKVTLDGYPFFIRD